MTRKEYYDRVIKYDITKGDFIVEPVLYNVKTKILNKLGEGRHWDVGTINKLLAKKDSVVHAETVEIVCMYEIYGYPEWLKTM